MIEVFVFILGLIVGSFLNALLYRLSINRSAFQGRSFCPWCTHELAARDLIPVISFILLRGRCRYCTKQISWQYPAIELATGISFLLIFLRLESTAASVVDLVAQFIAYAVFTSFLITIFVYDIRHYLILDKVALPGILFAFFANLLLGLIWWQMLLAAVIAGGFFAVQFALSRGTWVGGGDIRLGVLMGALLSWPGVLVALVLAYGIGGLVAMLLLAMKRKTLQSRVPFGPFLTLATFIALLYGQNIIDWYMNVPYLW